jgi:hypothetical protein
MPRKRQLEGVLAKIIRADEHFDSLKAEVRQYLAECAKTLSLPVKVNSRENTIRLTFEPIYAANLRISVILGDCIHNTRSAIDCLWKQLGSNGKFPMFSESDGIKNWLSQRTERLKDISTGARAVVDGLQPCHAGKSAPAHPLAILNTLSNTDKHDTIHFTKPLSANTSFVFTNKDTGQTFSIKPPVIFHYDTEVLIHDIPEASVKTGMDVQIKGTLVPNGIGDLGVVAFRREFRAA